jgi:trimeric autotransporter adhesin
MAASTQTIQKMYIAYFGRPADTIGLQYWADKTEAQIIAGFSASSESQALFGNQGSAAKVNAIYNNLFARDAEPAGLQYWVQKLESGQVSQAEAMYTILNNAGAGDATAVANKLAAAEAFTAQIDTTPEILGYTGANAAQSAREWLTKVNANTASLDAAKASAPAALAAAAGASAGDSGKTFTLTAGADTIVGTSGNDTINALSINAAGGAATTLSAFDNIDGGAGNDTLNIFADGTSNTATLAASATVKNVETINFNNSGAGFGTIDASKFAGATVINQTGVAGDVNNLAAGTTAGFSGFATAGTFNVAPADAATSAAVALTNVAEATDVNVTAGAAGVLNSVTVSGNVVDAGAKDGVISNITLDVTAGKDVESVSVNTAVATTLTVANTGTKAVSTVDASASTGAVTYSAAATVANVKTGAGNDTATLNTSLNATVKAASVSTGAGNDTVNVSAVVGTAATGQTVAVDSGEGNDTINLTIAAGVTYNVAAGAGDDTVVITNTVKTTDKIDGGVGTDVVSLAAKAAYVADDYIVFNKVLTNFETLKLTGLTPATLDASQLAATYTTIDVNDGSTVAKVGTQALIANGALTASTAGFVLDADANTAGNQSTYVGTLNITEKAAGTVTASAQTVNLTVEGAKANAPVANAVNLAGEATSAKVALSASTDTKGTVATTDDTLVASSVTITTATAAGGLKDLASLTLTGNGVANITNVDLTKLTTVDATGLNSVNEKGVATTGLVYGSTNTAAETIKLGSGLDSVTLSASTYGKMDVVTGLNLVAQAANAKAIDTAKSDVLEISGVNLDPAAAKAFTTSQTDLDLALKDAAAYSVANANTDVAFYMGGNTYVFHDSVAGNGLIDATDTVVQIVGQVNLDLLASSLNVA